MIASNMAGITGSMAQTVSPEIAIPKVEAKEVLLKESVEDEKKSVEEYVRNYFSDIPIMIEVARCESRFRQHDKHGNVLRGEENELDRGVMQINEYYHNEDSEKLGYDILTLEGNTAYARYLFEKYGIKPWKSSSRCWSKTSAYSEYKSLAAK